MESRLRQLGLVHDLLIIAGAQIALVRKENPLREDVAEFAAIELQLDGLAERLLMNVAQDVDGLDQPAEMAERAGEAVGGGRIDKPLHDNMGRGQPVFSDAAKRTSSSHCSANQVEVDGVAEQRLQRAVIAGAIDPAQDLVGEIL